MTNAEDEMIKLGPLSIYKRQRVQLQLKGLSHHQSS
jgi:hypothetical protein